MFYFIQNHNDFVHVLEQMDQCSVYGLDTEFIKIDTLWPKLGLFQININGQVYLLDGTTLDLTTFYQKLYKAKQNIFHACSEDIDLICQAVKTDALQNVFDTQIALSFLGYGLQVSYQKALQLVLNIEIEKDQTRSDWLARPLTPQQLDYAANDVIYLPELYQKIKVNLDEKGLYNYVLEDCQSLTKSIAKQTPLNLLYTELGHFSHSRKQLMQLQQLSVWREQVTKELNQPRSFILKNSTMVDMVKKNPKNIFHLSKIKDIRPNVIREYGEIILDLIHSLPNENEWPLSITMPIKQISKATNLQIEQCVEEAAQKNCIPKDVLLRKKWMNALYQYAVGQCSKQDLPPYLQGWRYSMLTEPLVHILHENEYI